MTLGYWTRRAAAMTIVLCVGSAASAQGQAGDLLETLTQHQEGEEGAGAVKAALAAPYLTEDERRVIRVEHGLWAEADLASPALRARAALLAGVWDDDSLKDPASAIEDRAEAMLRRGEHEAAIEALEGATSVRAKRLRAAALEGLGRFPEADAAVEPVVSDLLRSRFDDAEELVEGVRALMIRARVRGQPAQDYQRMIELLAFARSELDRLNVGALLAESELLYDKDNRQQAGESAAEALSLNPRNADAWFALGRLSVDGFDFDNARNAAAELDALERLVTGREDLVSPLGAVVRALAWLRQNDPEMAESELAPVLARYPDQREALALACATAALRWDEAGLKDSLARFEALSPGSPAALFAVGRALAEVRQYELAASYLERASAMQPNWPAPLIELGLLELQSGRDVRALDALRKATSLDPFNVRAANSLRLIEELLTYETIESEHFIVRFRPGVDGVMAREMMGPLEEIHRIVGGAIRHDPATKTVIELLPDHEWFGVRITGMPAIHTIAASTGPVIAMEAPKTGPKHLGEYDWVRVIRHEYVHTVTLSRTNNRIPHWFTEAAAVYLEGGPRDYPAASLLAAAVRNGELFDMRKINIAFVRPEKPTDRSQAYAQGHWMYEYIVERWGEQAPLDLMDQYAAGAREDAAMRSVLGVSQEQFFEDFKPWARDQARSWGMLPEPSLRDMVAIVALGNEAGEARCRELLRRSAERFAAEASTGSAAWPEAIVLPDPSPEMLDDWAARFPDHPDVLELMIGRELEMHDGDLTAEAIPLLEKYAAIRPVDPTPHRLLARLYLTSDDKARAIPHLEYLDVREQRSAAYAIELARRHAATNDLDRAASKAERATQIAPFDAGHREFAARIALLRKDFGAAERHILALTELEPDREMHRTRLEQVRRLMAGSAAAD